MKKNYINKKNRIEETIHGVVKRIKFHDSESGYYVLIVNSPQYPNQEVTVTTHHAKIIPGPTMEFRGHWEIHSKFGRQFNAVEAEEEKPASAPAMEKFLSSGLIKKIGTKRAEKIVDFFGDETFTILNEEPKKLIEIPGIGKILSDEILTSWDMHRGVQRVMTFLFEHGISTLFATRIHKQYGDRAIQILTERN